MFQGVYVATATPFHDDGSFDETAYQKHVEWLVQNGVHGLVPAGTTGESPTLSDEEKAAMFGICVAAAKGKAKVVAGAGTNSTAKSVLAAEKAARAGVDGVLAVNPYYNKPTQAGMVAHFQAIAAVGVPVMIYNIPGRTGVNMTPEAIAKAAAHPQIVAVKEASGTVAATVDLKLLAPRLDVLSGDDGLFLPCLAVGGDGIVSVAANVLPAELVALWNAWRAGDPARAIELNNRLWNLFRNLFVETNPIPVKAALHLMGRYGKTLRLPMTEATPETVQKVAATLKALGV
ncbi:MAG: 4-hydroxy-tetrahydrodipicolinate synthase [Myxococcales bacterium]|nr:4-hydroxy-tetrahydrodipicolinate synthase [Myxococcales bacterium]